MKLKVDVQTRVELFYVSYLMSEITIDLNSSLRGEISNACCTIYRFKIELFPVYFISFGTLAREFVRAPRIRIEERK